MVRSAFTMLELIVAIVIIGIAMLSLPTMSQSNTQAFENNIVQEAIFASSAKLSQLLTYSWDENSRVGDGQLAKVVDITLNGTGVYDRVGSSKFRAGHVRDAYHRQFHEIDSPQRAIVTAVDGNSNDLDDQRVVGQQLAQQFNAALASAAYKQNYTIDISVGFVGDGSGATAYTFPLAASGTPSNMKMVAVSIYKEDGKLITTLRAYAANIGESELFSRPY